MKQSPAILLKRSISKTESEGQWSSKILKWNVQNVGLEFWIRLHWDLRDEPPSSTQKSYIQCIKGMCIPLCIKLFFKLINGIVMHIR